jgi:hypothetical protein
LTSRKGTCLIESNGVNTGYYATLVLVSLAVFAGYIFIAYRSFFFQDDFQFLLPVIFKGLFVLPRADDVHFFRPVAKDLFYLVNYHIFGMESFYYFLTNVVAHTLSAICLFFILVKLRLSNKHSALIAFLFFANLAAFEKMSWIAYFQHTSYQVFLLMSALLAILSTEKDGRRRTVLLSFSVICWILSLLSHIAGILYPIILVMILFVKLRQDGDTRRSDIISALAKTTFAHWIVFFLYMAFIVLPHWKRTAITDPYYVDLSVTTVIGNLSYYCAVAVFTNYKEITLIFTAILYVVFFIPPYIKKILLNKWTIINVLIIAAVFGFLYAPFAFLKYQRYVVYVSLALIPWYIVILYPFFGDAPLQRVSPYLGKLLVVFCLLVLTLSFLPKKSDVIGYFNNCPRLHIKSVWDQMKVLVPYIPEGTRRIVFIDQEQFHHDENVPIWSIPPFWWHVGQGTMFAILYGRLDVKLEVATEQPIHREPSTIYIMVNKGPVYYSLSMLK